ncbi:unnamed protein product [Durusdinium trenchii]|uniref:Uncharacterized protein n=2 Tax=Durusdinium trenchii TaxID=1381693 RepID=A0ABP0LGV1_9DINO
MAMLGLVVLALACQVTLSYPQNCSTNGNCVSRIWSCQQQRSCTQADNFLLELDFHYREKGCREVIPLSKSVVQVDIDARCEKPSNFNDFFFGRRLNCRNMLRRGPPPRVVPAMACPSAQNVSDLVVEKCSWHCKHKRPVSRCFISFDPRNALGVQQKLDKCWIQEKCINNQMKAKTTCQTAPSSSTPAVTLAGSMLVTVTDPVTFLAQPNLQFALQDAIERMAPESDFSDVAIEIPSSNSLANKTKMVKVGFNASVKGNDDETSDEKALGAEMALQNISHDALVDAVNGALSSEGAAFDVICSASMSP